MKDVFEDGYVDVAGLPADVLEGVGKEGFNTTRAQRGPSARREPARQSFHRPPPRFEPV